MKILSSYDKEQLRIGTEIEMEHTDKKKVAEKIAKDHLDECSDYYTRLVKLERNCGKEKKNESFSRYITYCFSQYVINKYREYS